MFLRGSSVFEVGFAENERVFHEVIGENLEAALFEVPPDGGGSGKVVPANRSQNVPPVKPLSARTVSRKPSKFSLLPI